MNARPTSSNELLIDAGNSPLAVGFHPVKRQGTRSVRGNYRPVVTEDDEEADPVGENIAALLTLLDCPFSMILPYASYIAHEASFDTHQGVKGLEFDRVMVLLDDGDARGFLFGYDKLLGAKAPSASDLKNAEGKDSSLDRTRRLFYVTCSRAKSSLALVAYSTDPGAMKAHVIRSGLFSEDEVYLGLPT